MTNRTTYTVKITVTAHERQAMKRIRQGVGVIGDLWLEFTTICHLRNAILAAKPDKKKETK